MQRCPWPGNVRQLENLIESFFATGLEGHLKLADLPETIRSQPKVDHGDESGEPTPLSQAERTAIDRALRVCGGNKSRAAAMLKISRTRLYRKMREYGLAEFQD